MINKMQKSLPLLLLWAVWQLSCQDPEKILPDDGGRWLLRQGREELYLDGGLVSGRDLSGVDTLVFFGSGALTRSGPAGSFSYRWAYDKGPEKIRVTGLEYLETLRGQTILRKDFDFTILDRQPGRQIWRAEQRFGTYSPFTADSAQASVVIQWQIQRAP